MFIAFLLVMLVATLVLFTLTRVSVERIERNHYRQRVSFFEAHPLKSDEIAFLGDSLTAGGNWDEIFPGLPIKNRGINADTTVGALQRLDCITRGKPAAIFMLIGTNDLPWFEHRHDEMILATYQEMLDKIKNDTPETRIFVESLLPRAHSYARRVRGLNAKLQVLAEQNGATFIDLYSHFTDANGDLRAELNNDHIHVLAQGYAIWAEVLRPYLDSLLNR
jgi:lysophospholipase L1-like esterase